MLERGVAFQCSFQIVIDPLPKKDLAMDDYQLVIMPGPGWPSWVSIKGDDKEEDFLNDVSTVFQYFRGATQYFMQNR